MQLHFFPRWYLVAATAEVNPKEQAESLLYVVKGRQPASLIVQLGNYGRKSGIYGSPGGVGERERHKSLYRYY